MQSLAVHVSMQRLSADKNDVWYGNSDTEQGNDPNLVIWGTNVVVSKCKKEFVKFIQRLALIN